MQNNGIVIKSTGSWYNVKLGTGEIINCKIKGNLRITGIKSTNPVAIGDKVRIVLTDKETGMIAEVFDRKNYIIRKPSNLSKQVHVIAANLDVAVLVVTIVFPETQFEFIDRFLATSEAYQIPAIIVFNKIDLFSNELLDYLDEIMEVYEHCDYRCFKVSALKNIGIEEIKSELAGKTSLVAGNSGVGKSTFINAIDSRWNLKTSEISDYHLKGKHTTSHSEMFELSEGGYIIDTPGIKGFGIINFSKEEIFHFFPEMFRISHNCQFYNCTHIHEPNCAVLKAVESGEISDSRYRSYLSIYNEENQKYRYKSN